jgi:hypothetical protein
METKRMFELAAALGEAKNRQNVEDALKFMHEDIVLYSPAWGVVARGKAENAEVLHHFFHDFPDYNVSFDGYVGDGENFVGWGTVRMTMADHAYDVVPNMTFKDNLIASEYFMCDLAEICAQSGVSVDAVRRNLFGSNAVTQIA